MLRGQHMQTTDTHSMAAYIMLFKIAAAMSNAVQTPSATRPPSSASRELSRANGSGARSPSKTLKSAGSGSAELSGHTHHK